MDRRGVLATRANQVDLVGWASGQQDKSWAAVLNTEARAEDWRLIELFSGSGRAFEAEVRWTAGDGAGGAALLTVSRSTRVCVLARSLLVRVSNLHSAENRVGCSVAQPEGFVATENVYELPFQVAAAESLSLALPPMARRVRVEVSDPELAKTLSVQLLDGQGQLRVQVAGDAQPLGGLQLGGADQLVLGNAHLSSIVLGRVVFTLAL
jgi:hypothetical protein